MTSEQSTSVRGSCPRTASFAIAPSNLDTISWWLFTKDCHSQAVRASRAMAASDWRRNSPWRGESTSPTLEPFPGKSVPSRSVCGRWALDVYETRRAGRTHLDEELWVEGARGGVERSSLNGNREHGFAIER